MKKNFVMTEKQKEYATEHHDLVYKYLQKRGLSVDDYYDVVIPGYLRAVVRYDEEKELQQYKFSTIAWGGMRSALSTHRRYLSRKKRNADVLSLDADLSNGNEFSLLDTLAAADNPAQDLDDKQLWLEVYSLLNESQWKLIQMRLTGYSNQAISRQLKIPFYDIDTALLGVWNNIKGLFGGDISMPSREFEKMGA